MRKINNIIRVTNKLLLLTFLYSRKDLSLKRKRYFTRAFLNNDKEVSIFERNYKTNFSKHLDDFEKVSKLKTLEYKYYSEDHILGLLPLGYAIYKYINSSGLSLNARIMLSNLETKLINDIKIYKELTDYIIEKHLDKTYLLSLDFSNNNISESTNKFISIFMGSKVVLNNSYDKFHSELTMYKMFKVLSLYYQVKLTPSSYMFIHSVEEEIDFIPRYSLSVLGTHVEKGNKFKLIKIRDKKLATECGTDLYGINLRMSVYSSILILNKSLKYIEKKDLNKVILKPSLSTKQRVDTDLLELRDILTKIVRFFKFGKPTDNELIALDKLYKNSSEPRYKEKLLGTIANSSVEIAALKQTVLGYNPSAERLETFTII